MIKLQRLYLFNQRRKGCTNLIIEIPCAAREHKDIHTQRLYLHDKPRRGFSLNVVKRKPHRDKANEVRRTALAGRRASESYIDTYK